MVGCACIPAFFLDNSMEDYERHILRVLSEAGRNGLKLSKIVKHVYNACNTFFDNIDYDDVYDRVHRYLRRNSRKGGFIVSNAGKRGYYRLNMRSEKARELLAQVESFLGESASSNVLYDE